MSGIQYKINVYSNVTRDINGTLREVDARESAMISSTLIQATMSRPAMPTNASVLPAIIGPIQDARESAMISSTLIQATMSRPTSQIVVSANPNIFGTQLQLVAILIAIPYYLPNMLIHHLQLNVFAKLTIYGHPLHQPASVMHLKTIYGIQSP